MDGLGGNCIQQLALRHTVVIKIGKCSPPCESFSAIFIVFNVSALHYRHPWVHKATGHCHACDLTRRENSTLPGPIQNFSTFTIRGCSLLNSIVCLPLRIAMFLYMSPDSS